MNLKKFRILLYILFFIVVGLLWIKWDALNYKYAQQQSAQSTQQSTSTTPTPNASTLSEQGVPPIPDVKHPSQNQPSSQTIVTSTQKTIQVKTSVFDILIGLNNGNIIQTNLNQYYETLKDKQKFNLLNNQQGKYYIIKSGMLSNDIPQNLMFKSAQTHYVMGNQKQLVVKLTSETSTGIELNKTYTFTKGSYAIKLNQSIVNNSGHPIEVRSFGQLSQKPFKKTHTLLNSYITYDGTAYSTPDKHFTKLKFKNMKADPLNQMVKGGWVSMIQHYFMSAWVPEQSNTNQFYTTVSPNGIYTIGTASKSATLENHQSWSSKSSMYIGPIIAKNLAAVAPHLDLSLDYGWLWFLSDIIFWLLYNIHHIVGNWGWSIVLVTLLIKAVFHPLSTKSYRSMAMMRKLQPKINQLKEQLGDDRQKMGKATMELYRKEKVNPLGGCLPMLVQIPVFIALYWVLIESVELRQAPFIFWIKDLSVKDPYYILPVLMGLSMFGQQLLNPSPPDKTQARIMMAMPIVFTVLFLNFPAGLVLYWLVNNCVSISQQWWVYRSVENTSKKPGKMKRKKA